MRKGFKPMHGAEGWYGWQDEPWNVGALELWYLSMRADDLARVDHGWTVYLQGRNDAYPVTALRRDLEVGLGREHVVLLGLTQRQRPQLEDLTLEGPQPALRDGRGTNTKWRADRVHGHEHEGRQPPGEQGRGAQLEIAGLPQPPAW